MNNSTEDEDAGTSRYVVEGAHDTFAVTLLAGSILTVRAVDGGALLEHRDGVKVARESCRVDAGEVRTYGPHEEAREVSVHGLGGKVVVELRPALRRAAPAEDN